MKLILSAAVVCIAFVSTAASAEYSNTNDVQVSQKIIPVKLKRGQQTEIGRLIYTSWVRLNEQESGKASTITHPIDNRQCGWSISAHMQRQYFVTSVLGAEDSLPASGVVVPLTINGKSNGLASVLDHDPCSDFRSRIDQDVASLKAATLAQFDARMNEDLAKFKTETAGVTVIVTP